MTASESLYRVSRCIGCGRSVTSGARGRLRKLDAECARLARARDYARAAARIARAGGRGAVADALEAAAAMLDPRPLGEARHILTIENGQKTASGAVEGPDESLYRVSRRASPVGRLVGRVRSAALSMRGTR